MGIVSGINRFIGLFVDTFKQFGRGGIWLVLLAYFLFNWLILYAHYNFMSPVFYGIVTFWTGLFGDQRATGFTHYPGHLLLLPYYFGWARFYVGIVLEGAVLGAVALMFYRAYLGVAKTERPTLRNVLSSWIHLVLAWLLINGLILIANLYIPKLLESWLYGSPRRIMAVEYVGLPLVYIVILALFFSMIPAVIVFRENFLKALKRALRVAIKNPFTSFFLSLIVLIGPIFISVVSGRSAEIVQKFKPELVYWLLLAGLVVDVLFFFFWMGTSVRLLVDEEA